MMRSRHTIFCISQIFNKSYVTTHARENGGRIKCFLMSLILRLETLAPHILSIGKAAFKYHDIERGFRSSLKVKHLKSYTDKKRGTHHLRKDLFDLF